jgi:hypothetical protein
LGDVFSNAMMNSLKKRNEFTDEVDFLKKSLGDGFPDDEGKNSPTGNISKKCFGDAFHNNEFSLV